MSLVLEDVVLRLVMRAVVLPVTREILVVPTEDSSITELRLAKIVTVLALPVAVQAHQHVRHVLLQAI